MTSYLRKKPSKGKSPDVDELMRNSLLDEVTLNANGGGQGSKTGILEEPGIEAPTIKHIAGKAKKYNILNGYQRYVLFSLGQALYYRGGLTRKQIYLLNVLLREAKRAGLDKKTCDKGPCERCEEFRQYNVNK